MLGEGAADVLKEPAGEVSALGLLHALDASSVGELDADVGRCAVYGQTTVPDGLVEGDVVGVLVVGHLPVAAR